MRQKFRVKVVETAISKGEVVVTAHSFNDAETIARLEWEKDNIALKPDATNLSVEVVARGEKGGRR